MKRYIIIGALLASAITSGCVATTASPTAKTAPTPAPHVPVEAWSTVTINSQPTGAAIVVGGDNYGYAPVTINVQTFDGMMTLPVLICAYPTQAGQYTQTGRIGPWGIWPNDAPVPPPASVTFYMYNNNGQY
jgi:hypothetical protein